MKSLHLTLAASTLLASAAFAADSAYTPAAGAWEVTTGYQFSTFDHFWEGNTRATLLEATGAYKSKDQHVFSLGVSYGITDSLSFDVNSGYVWTELSNGGPSDSGISDTTAGFRYVLANEAAGDPLQLTLHGAGIIAGSYDAGDLFSVGQGESGFESSLLLGKKLTENLGLYGEFGYRWYSGNVPAALYGAAGAYASFGPVTLSAGYRQSQSLSGGDIGGPGFGVSYGVPETKQISKVIEIGLGVSDSGGRYYQLYYARTLDGRNVDERGTVGVAITIPFGGKAPRMDMAPSMMTHSGK